MISAVVNSRILFCLVLALPSIPMVRLLVDGQPGLRPATSVLLHPSGEWAARFLIAAMIVTPLAMLFPRSRFWRWMTERRRHLGVAAFAYAAAHTVLYVVDIGSLAALLGDFLAFGIWTGWAAFFLFVPLALTSNAVSVRLLGPGWRRLHRLVYPAAVAALLHWIFVHNALGPALAHFLPLAALEIWRVRRHLRNRSATAA